MPNPDTITNDIHSDTMRRAFLARVDAASMNASELAERYRDETAQSLLLAGISLIPSDHLLDHQFVVSRKMYEAALRQARKVSS